MPYFFGLLYTTIGYVFALHYKWLKMQINNIKILTLILVFIFSWLGQIGEVYLTELLLDNNKGVGDYYLSTIPLTISLFLILLKKKQFGKKTFLMGIGKNSLGIYVLHMLFVSVMVLGFNFLNIEIIREYFLFNLLMAFIILIVSHAVFVIIYKVKKFSAIPEQGFLKTQNMRSQQLK